MKNSWVLVTVISGFLSGILTFIFTQNWKISLAACAFTIVVVFLRNPRRRFMRAFYVILFTLIAKIWFLLDITTDKFDIKIGLNKLNDTSIIALSCLAFLCLLLDFFERKGYKSFLWGIKKNKIGNINGDDNKINQNID